jgi:hypothetical protein
MVRPWAEAGFKCVCVDIAEPIPELAHKNIQHVNALEKILKKADEDDMSRFSYWDFQRFLLMTMEIGRIIGMKDLKVTFTPNNA